MSDLREEVKREVLDRLEAFSKKSLSPRDAYTVDSLTKYVKKRSCFTPPQWGLLQILEERYSEESVEERRQWVENYPKCHRQDALICAHYYNSTGNYFLSISRKIVEEEGFVPTIAQYKKLCTNKYAKRVLEQHHAEPKYKVGEMVRLRTGAGSGWRPKIRIFKGPAFIIKTDADWITSAARGAKKYLVLPIGSTKPSFYEERHLKFAKQRRRVK